jgi:hypothetical protein
MIAKLATVDSETTEQFSDRSIPLDGLTVLSRARQ